MENFRNLCQVKFNQMQQSGKLFRVALTGIEIWDLYLSNMNGGVFRDPSSNEYNCNICNSFFRRYSNIVSINNNFEIETIFDIELNPNDEYYNAAKVLSNAIKNSFINNVFFETYDELNKLPYETCKKTNSIFQLGIPTNSKYYNSEEVAKFGKVVEGKLYTFNHLALKLNSQFVDKSGKSVESIMGEYKSAYDVFKRGIETISLDTLELVRDLINQGSLLDGTTHLYKVEQFIQLKKEYNDLNKNQRDNWCWFKSYNLPLAKFRNELIGTLCVELTEGSDLNEACKNWNKRVDPANYMKAKAPITTKQIKEAQKFVEENGYESAFIRRFATLDDIKLSEILHIHQNHVLKSASIFDTVKSTSTQHKRSEFDGVQEVTIEEFMSKILPTCTGVEAYLTNSMEGNLCTLLTSNEDSKQIFKWNNSFNVTFNGNLAGKSMIKQAVKEAGGNIEGVLSCRLAWNQSGKDNSDLDLWNKSPDGSTIGYSTSYRKDKSNRFSPMSGQLDVK